MTSGLLWPCVLRLVTAMMLMNWLDDDVLNPSTIADPNIVDAPFTRRSGEIAPLKLNSALSDALPVLKVTAVVGVGLTSYHRTSAPAPPNTVCWVQMATLVLGSCEGSTAEMALVSRVSDESSLKLLPFWTALAGVVNEDTETFFAGPTTIWLLAFFVTLNTDRKLAEPNPADTIQPVALGSVWFTGTGVKAGELSA